MGTNLRLGIARASYIICWSVFGGLVLDVENLPAGAVDQTLVERGIRKNQALNFRSTAPKFYGETILAARTLKAIRVDSAEFIHGKSTASSQADSVAPILAQSIPPTPVNRPILKIGSQGDAVSELQAALKLLGFYRDVVDGVYQESTAIAVSQFQQAANLPVDGIAGPATWNRLFPSAPSAQTPPPSSSTSPASSFPVPSAISDRPATSAANLPTPANSQPSADTLPILRKGMQGPAVVQLQERLQALGLLTGSVDGVFGDATQAAVQAAQQSFNINPDGIVGPATWSALLR